MSDGNDITPEDIDYYINQLKQGDAENAYFCLIEADHMVLPHLQEAFHSEEDASIRSALIEVIYQFRLKETIPFLAQALDDPDPQVWKAAIDGLVMLSSTEAMEALKSAMQRPLADRRDAETFKSWLVEAIEQMKQGSPGLGAPD